MNELRQMLPEDPMPLLARWLDEAVTAARTPNPNAMVIATVDTRDGVAPAARVVLCKHLDIAEGYVVFYTNYESRKGREMARCPRAAALFHWDSVGRQARIEGPVLRSPTEESDAYFASRGRGSQIGAWASNQSRPIASRTDLQKQVRDTSERFPEDATVPRPPHWGGYRLWAERVELWVHGDDRLHDRIVWHRPVDAGGGLVATAGNWSHRRLQP